MTSPLTPADMELTLVQDAPDIFYNDPKNRCFEIVLKLQCKEPRKLEQADEIEMPLAASILYEDNSPVDDQNVLQPVLTKTKIVENKPALLKYRISQVSRRHLNKRFRVQFSCAPEMPKILVCTSPIEVRSKKASAPKKPATPAISPLQMQQQQQELLTSLTWIRDAREWMKGHVWQPAGYEFDQTAVGQEIINRSKPIFRCISCGVLSSKAFPRPIHHKDCKASVLLQHCPRSAPSERECPVPDFPVMFPLHTQYVAQAQHHPHAHVLQTVSVPDPTHQPPHLMPFQEAQPAPAPQPPSNTGPGPITPVQARLILQSMPHAKTLSQLHQATHAKTLSQLHQATHAWPTQEQANKKMRHCFNGLASLSAIA